MCSDFQRFAKPMRNGFSNEMFKYLTHLHLLRIKRAASSTNVNLIYLTFKLILRK